MSNRLDYISENTPFIITAITNDNFVGVLDYSGHTIGDIVCLSELYGELIERFGSYEDAKNVYNLCRSLINNGQYIDYFNTNGGSVPYIDVPIYLEEEFVDNGLFSPCIEKWVPGKTYHVGDMVYYSIDGTDENMLPYILEHGETKEENVDIGVIFDRRLKNRNTIIVSGNISGLKIGDDIYIGNKNYTISRIVFRDNALILNSIFDLRNVSVGDTIYKIVKTRTYDLVEIPYEIYNAYSGNTSWDQSTLVEDGGKYYLKVEVYSGYYDEDYRLLYFDDLDANRNLVFNHWLLSTVLNNTDYGTPSEEERVSPSESMLLNLKRQKTSMDDDKNLLPFIIHYNERLLRPGESGYIPQRNTKKRVPSTTETECFYMPGMTNTKINENGIITCDYLKSVTFSGETTIITFNQLNEPIVCDESFSDYTEVMFEYYIGCEIDDEGGPKTETGVKYDETREFTLEYMDITVDGVECDNLPYIVLSDNYSFAKDDNIDLANSGYGITPAYIGLLQEQLGKTEFEEVGIFKDELLNEVQDMSDEIDVDIDRGMATSFERHNALGEINTMQDLEYYRNDYFDISEQ